jgi:hypothetical protein
MNLAFAAVGALTLTVTAVGCGSAPKPSVQPDLAGKPTWGACWCVTGAKRCAG